LGGMRECEPWCGDYEVRAETAAVCVLVHGSVFQLKTPGGVRTFCCHEKALAAANLKMERRKQPEFYGEGIAPLLVAEQKKLNLKADAERLAELRDRSYQVRDLVDDMFDCAERRNHQAELTRLRTLIAVYEECAARGIAFGGGK